MKKIIFTVLIFLLTAFAALPLTVSAEGLSDEEAEISRQVDEMMYQSGVELSYADIGGLSLGDMAEKVRGMLCEQLSAPIKLLGTILVAAVFTAVMKSFGGGFLTSAASSDLCGTICVMASVAVITPQLLDVYGSAMSAVERTGGFIAVFVPVFSGITIASGGIVSGGIYNVMTLAASEVFVGLSRSYLMPLLSVTAMLSVSGSVFPNASVEGFTALIRKLVTWSLTVAMTLFTGFVTLKCSLSGKADGVAVKAAKFVVSGAVPIVGGAVSDAYSAVRGGFEVIRGTVGTAGVLAAVLIMLPPILRILVFRGVMWLGTAAAELFSAQPLVKLMKGLESGLAIAQSVLICYAVMFVLCTAILMQTIG